MDAAALSCAQDGAEVMGVGDAVRQNEKGQLTLLLGDSQKLIDRGVGDKAHRGRNTLMALAAAESIQLFGMDALDDRPALLGKGGIIAGLRVVKREKDGVCLSVIFQEFRNGIFAENDIFMRLFCHGTSVRAAPALRQAVSRRA